MTLILFMFMMVLMYSNSQMQSCIQTFGNSSKRTYNLNRLSKFTLNGTDTPTGHVFWFSPCNTIPNTTCTDVTSAGAMSCQLLNKDVFYEYVSYMDGFKGTNATYEENPDGPGTGVIMTTQNGDDCNPHQWCSKRIMIAKFICDKTIEIPSIMDVTENPLCTHNFVIRAHGACPVKN
jgi:hypothetical protein